MNNSDSSSDRVRSEPAAKRRDTLKRLVSGSAGVALATLVPDKWTRPVVDSVLLPTHATTSCTAAVIEGTDGFLINSQPGFDIDFTVDYTVSVAGDISVRWTLLPLGGGSIVTNQDLGFVSAGSHSATTTWTGLAEGQYGVLIDFFSCSDRILAAETGFELPINP